MLTLSLLPFYLLSQAMTAITIFPNSVCLEKKSWCTCMLTPVLDRPSHTLYYGDLCLINPDFMTVESWEVFRFYECRAPEDCYCGPLARWKDGDIYCIKGFLYNYFSPTVAFGLMATSQAVAQKGRELRKQNKYGPYFDHREFMTEVEFQAIWPEYQ
jgi:hypothetical protein